MLPDKALPGDFERNRMVDALPGPEVAERPALEVAADNGLCEGHSSVWKVGEVRSLGNAGFGTGRGLMYLSAGSIVLRSELVELTLAFLERLPLRTTGTFRTLTSWPGSIGHEVVEGSAELWNSRSSSSL